MHKNRLVLVIDNIGTISYLARSQNFKKRLLTLPRLSICLSVRLSVLPLACLHGTILVPLDGFSLKVRYEYFSKNLLRKFISIISDRNKRNFI
jgi:hypothetical protein